MQTRGNQVFKTAFVEFFFLPCLLSYSAMVDWFGGMSAGWDFHGLAADEREKPSQIPI